MVERKREMSGFDMLCLEQEFKRFLEDGNFDKAYQPSRDEVLLRFRSPSEGRFDVAIGLGRYITRTTNRRENPTHPPEFTKQLRNHLSGGKVLDVHQHAFDRIIVFEIGKREGAYKLVVECFHDGNVVLVLDGDVVLPLIHTEWSSRTVRPNAEWAFPPSEVNPRSVNEPQYIETLRGSNADIIRTLSSVGNLGPVWAQEVALRAGMDPHRDISGLDATDLAKITGIVMNLVEKIREDPEPVIVYDEEGDPVNATPVPMLLHEDADHERVDTLSEALDQLFGPHVEEGPSDARLDEVEDLKDTYRRRVAMLNEQIQGFDQKEDDAKQQADLLYAHYQDVQTILQQAAKVHEEEGWGPLVQADLRSGNVALAKPKPETGMLEITLPDAEGNLHHVDIELGMGVDANAERLYEASKEARAKKKGAKKALAKAKKNLDEMEERGEEIVEELKAKQAQPDPTHRFWFERFRWSYASTGNLMLAGRDASTNEKVVKKHLDDNDRYLHANFSGAPSVVVKTNDDGDVPDQALQEAAQFAVAYSSAWQDRLGESEAYWVTPPQVTKTPESGEYVPTGSFIIRGDRSYLRSPVQAAIGDTRIQKHYKVMGGPVNAVKDRCERYVVLEPGRTDPGDLASILSQVFDVPVEEIQGVLPPGSVRIVETNGIDETAFAEVDR